jgi:hypothetical protein
MKRLRLVRLLLVGGPLLFYGGLGSLQSIGPETQLNFSCIGIGIGIGGSCPTISIGNYWIGAIGARGNYTPRTPRGFVVIRYVGEVIGWPGRPLPFYRLVSSSTCPYIRKGPGPSHPNLSLHRQAKCPNHIILTLLNQSPTIYRAPARPNRLAWLKSPQNGEDKLDYRIREPTMCPLGGWEK